MRDTIQKMRAERHKRLDALNAQIMADRREKARKRREEGRARKSGRRPTYA